MAQQQIIKEVKNVYQKVQRVRNELQKLKLKKSGENKFSHYSYYELGDFLPALNKLMDEQGIMTRFVLTEQKAILEVFNSEKPEDKISFFSPVASAEVKGANAIQSLGSQITYLRRYLLMTAFEIAESDTVDGQEQEEIKELDKASIARINAVKTLKELASLSKVIMAEKGEEYRKSMIIYYTRRKKELEEQLEDELAEGAGKLL